MRARWMTRTTARVAVACLIGMAIAAAAGAQSAEKISNIDATTQVVTIGGSDDDRDQVAQAFTTGPATMGWALEKVVLYVADWPANTADVEVTIHDASGTTIGAMPRDMSPGSTNTGLVSWTPDMPVTLTGGTAYYVKAHNTTTGTLNQDWLRIRAIQGDGENAGGATGWSIANDRLDREGTGTWGANGWSIQMAVHAREINPTPTVSIEATHALAMPYFAYPEWTLTLSEVPATDVTVGLSFASSLMGLNYLDAGTSGTITVPAGQTSLKQKFPMTMYTGKTPGTVTATVKTGTGYTVAAAPDNAASVSVRARDKLLITTVPADTQRTVTEGDRYEFSLTWKTAPLVPAPRERILFTVEPNSSAETASHDGDGYGPDDYEQGIVGATVNGQQNRVALEPGDWTVTSNLYQITKQFAIVTTEDSELELAEPIEIVLTITGSGGSAVSQGVARMGYTGGACEDSRFAQFRAEGLCTFDVIIEDDDGTARLGAELVRIVEEAVSLSDQVTTVRTIKVKLDRAAPTGGIGINLRVRESQHGDNETIETGGDFLRGSDEGDRVLRFLAGETEKTVDVRLQQTPGLVEAAESFIIYVDLLEGDDYARLGSNFSHSTRVLDADAGADRHATWKPGTELNVDEDTGTVTLTAESSVLFNWEVRRTIGFGGQGGRVRPTENADFTISSKRLIWPARTRTAEVELEIADDEIGEDDEWLTLIITAPETVVGCAPDCEGIVWGETGQSDNQDLIIADNDPVRVEVTHDAGIETRITEGESFTLTAEIVPPCEPGTRGFDLNVPLTKRLGNEVLASDVPDSSSIRLQSCIEPVSVTYATVDDTNDESRNNLFVSFKVGTPTPNSQIYDGDADDGKFEAATDAIGFRVIDNDGYGDSLTAVPDSSTGPPETCPPDTTTHCQGREGEGVPPMKVEGPVTWDPILNDAYPNGDASNITITSVTQPANGTVEIIDSGKKLRFTRDDTLKNLTDSPGNDIRVMRFNYTIEAPRHADDGGGTLRDTTDVSASIWPCDPAPCGGTGTQQANEPPRSTAASIAPESDSAWDEGDTVAIKIDWDEEVTVTGTPRVSLTLDPGARTATYASGSGTSTLTFEYRIGSSDGTVYSALLTADSLELNGGTIRDADGTDAVLDHQGAGLAYTAPRTTPKSTPPQATAVAIDAQNDSSWKPGDPVKVRIDWNEDVTVNGKPTVALVLDGDANRKATYSSGNATSQLVFTYEVDADDGWVYSVALTASSLALGGGSIRDDDGTDASLRHDGTQRAYTPPPPLTVSWTAPDEHDGGTFMFEVEFSDELAEGYSYRTLRDQTLTASGGRVTKARRLQQGGQREWEITVEPDATTSDVTLRLDGGAACGTAAAVCTDDGRPLSNNLSKTVAGPVGVSVADAEVEEGDDAEVSFTVTLSKAATRTASVDYATQNGTATSGDDYTATSGTLTFAAGDTSKTVAVEVLDDDHDEGSETFKLVLSNPSNAVISDAEGTGTIKNRDPLPRALLARFGRAAAVHVVEQIQQRIEAPRNPATSVRFAGHEVGGLTDAGNAVGLLQSIGSAYGVDGAQTLNSGYGAVGTTAIPAPNMGMSTGIVQGAGMGFEGSEGLPPSPGGMPSAMPPTHEQAYRPNLLARSELAINRAAGDGGSIAFWSRTAESSFAGRAGDVTVNGNVRTTLFGTDYAKDRLIVGLSVGRSFGDGAYQRRGTGATHTSVVGIYPWIGYRVNERTTVWGVSGYGRGRLRLTPERGAALTSPMTMRMHAAGAQGQLTGNDSIVGLTLKTDVLQAVTSIDGVETPEGRLAPSRADVSRIRSAVEGSRTWTMGRWMSLRPSVEVGIRRDAGDAEQGAGIDVGTGLLLTERRSGLQIDVRMRRLLMHQAEGFEEQGTSISISYNPRPQSPLGWTAEVEPGWGSETRGGADRLWSRETMGGMAMGTSPGRRLRARVGHGSSLGGNWVGTPGMTIMEHGAGRRLQLDYQVKPRSSDTLDVGLSVIGERATNNRWGGTSNGLRTEARVSW